MNIYKSGLGDNLMNPVFFTEAVRQYLKGEEKLLMSLSTSYDTLIEIGCTAGRYAEAITRLGKDYVGIDIADHHILRAAHLHKGNEREHPFFAMTPTILRRSSLPPMPPPEIPSSSSHSTPLVTWTTDMPFLRYS